jgi:signal transduction histidine kinase
MSDYENRAGAGGGGGGYPGGVRIGGRKDRQREARAELLARQTELAVAAERNRIAREMHDVVAHSLSVIVLQADGGRYAAAADPEAAIRALATIAETGRAALADTRRILGLLRGDDEAERAPVPEAGSIAELVAEMRSSGLDIAHVQTGLPRPLPPGAAVAAYRICQESLTNVLKHAGPGVRVTVSEAWGEAGLRLIVSNTPGTGALTRQAAPGHGFSGPGHGLVGMRERAELFGGTLAAGVTEDGGYRVRLELPFPEGGEW